MLKESCDGHQLFFQLFFLFFKQLDLYLNFKISKLLNFESF